MNVVAMQMSLDESVYQASLFVLGAVLVEVIYVRIALVAIDWLVKRKKIMKYMEWATFLIILALAIGSFVAAAKGGKSKNILLDNDMNRFLLGMMINAVNAVQIPFWFGWTTVLITRKILLPKASHNWFFLIGLAIGTLMGKTIYILGGPWLINKLSNVQDYLNWVIGGIFLITALILLFRILSKKGIESKMNKLEKSENPG